MVKFGPGFQSFPSWVFYTEYYFYIHPLILDTTADDARQTPPTIPFGRALESGTGNPILLQRATEGGPLLHHFPGHVGAPDLTYFHIYIKETQRPKPIRDQNGERDQTVALDLITKFWDSDPTVLHSLLDRHKDSFFRVAGQNRYTDIFALTSCGSRLPQEAVTCTGLTHCMSDNCETTFIGPPKTKEVEFLVDFDRETVGFIFFEITAHSGTILDFNFFEAMHNGKWIRTDNLNNTMRYTCRTGRQSYTSYVRRGGRYLHVTIRNFHRPIGIHAIRLLENIYPVQKTGSFCSSDMTLNHIWEMGARTTALCMDDTFVDCPAYEQSFWVGDMRNEALAAYTAFGETQLTKHCLRLAATSMESADRQSGREMANPTKSTPTPRLTRSRMVECVVPAGDGKILVNWSFLWTIAVWEFFTVSADLGLLQEMWPYLEQTGATIRDHIEANGLFRFPAWNMMDWAPMDTPSHAYITNENGWAYRSLHIIANVCRLLGQDKKGKFVKETINKAETMKQAINELLWDEKQKAYADCLYPDGRLSKTFSQQTQTVLVLTECVPLARRSIIYRHILNPPINWVRASSPWMLWFVFEAVAKMDKIDMLPRLLASYWGPMLKAGATTCWETFETSFGGRWQPTRSWCHAWSAAPTWSLARAIIVTKDKLQTVH